MRVGGTAPPDTIRIPGGVASALARCLSVPCVAALLASTPCQAQESASDESVASELELAPGTEAELDAPLLDPPPIEELMMGAGDPSSSLVTLRIEHVQRRRREGWGLAVWGGLSLVGGAIVAIAGRDDPAWLAFGLTTISYGAINLPLGILQLDLRGRAVEDALELTAATPALVAERLDDWLRGERGKRVSFAVNAGLDVLYILAGALMVGLAARTRNEASNRGAGWGMISQGAGLMIYDLWGIYATTRRIRELRAADPLSGLTF